MKPVERTFTRRRQDVVPFLLLMSILELRGQKKNNAVGVLEDV
jgi:hypothetical protein